MELISKDGRYNMVKNVLKILASIIMMTAVATMTVQAATDGNSTQKEHMHTMVLDIIRLLLK